MDILYHVVGQKERDQAVQPVEIVFINSVNLNKIKTIDHTFREDRRFRLRKVPQLREMVHDKAFLKRFGNCIFLTSHHTERVPGEVMVHYIRHEDKF